MPAGYVRVVLTRTEQLIIPCSLPVCDDFNHPQWQHACATQFGSNDACSIALAPASADVYVGWNHADHTPSSPLCPQDLTACSLDWRSGLWEPLALDLTWQVLYCLKTDVIEAAKFAADPTLLSALRWRIKYPDSATAVAHTFGRAIRMLGP
jgi:hypothetical protein